MRRFSLSLGFMVLLLSAWFSGAAVADASKVPITTASAEAREEFLKGRSLAEKLQAANALKHFDKAIALDPSFASALLARANASQTAKDFFAHLKRAVSAADNVSEGERSLILATDAASAGNSAKQREYLEKVVALFPDDERAHFALGGFYFGQQQYAAAIEQYRKSVEEAPDYSPAYNLLGYAYRQVENYPEAETAFKKYIKLIPGDPNPYDSYAELLMKEGKFDESIDYYHKALAIDDHFVASRIGIATNYMYKGMHDAGGRELKKLYDMARNDGERRQAVFAQTVLYVDNGKMALAVREAEKEFAIAQKINDVSSMSADLVFKGNILREMGEYDEARTAFNKSVQMITSSDLSGAVKDNATLLHHYNSATVAVGKSDLSTARAEAEEFRRGAGAGKNANLIRLSHELRGMIALEEKDFKKAIAELQQASLQNPYNLYRLGWAYQTMGDDKKAKEFYAKAANFNGLPQLNYAFVRTKAKMAAM